MEKAGRKLSERGPFFGLVEPGPALIELWPQCVSYVAEALSHSVQHEWSSSEVYARIERGEFLLAVVASGRSVIGAIVFDIATDPRGRKYVAVVCCGGRDLAQWLGGLVALCKHLALMAQAQRIVIVGRRGWARILRHYRLRVEAVIAGCDTDAIDCHGEIEVVPDFQGVSYG